MVLTHPGLVCSVGLNAAAACAAMRAGISGFAELPFRDNSGEPVIGAMVPGLAPTLRREERLLKLLELALTDCLKSASLARTSAIPLLVGLAESGRPGGGDVLAGELIPRLSRQLQRTFHPELSRCLPGGHTAAFELLKLTRELLQDPAVPVCLVAAVDSFVNDPSLAWLEHHGRLKTLDNSDGVIPGEAGTAIIVQRAAEEQTPPASARITGLGFAFESASVLNEEPLRGLGLAAATKSALAEAAIQMHQVDFRLSDVTGESYGFKEQALALSRLMRQRREELPLWHVADSIGDSGAAAGLCHYIAAMTAFGKKYSPGSTAACFGSAVPGERAVAILQSCQSPR